MPGLRAREQVLNGREEKIDEKEIDRNWRTHRQKPFPMRKRRDDLFISLPGGKTC
jgi:hypothetical protein